MTMKPTTKAQRALAKIKAAEVELDAAVTRMRLDGMTWAEVAEVLGMTRQSAWKRWGRGEAGTAA